MRNLSPRRSKSYAAAALADVDGIKTTFATSTSAVQLVPADFNGAVILSGGRLDLPRAITISRSNNANQFSVAPIVVTGMRGGQRVQASIAPANDDGNDVLRFLQAFDMILTVDIPAQAGTGGTFQIGVEDICAPAGETFCAVELAADGVMNLQYGESGAVTADAIPIVVANSAIRQIAASRVLTSPALAAPTTVGLTVYLA